MRKLISALMTAGCVLSCHLAHAQEVPQFDFAKKPADTLRRLADAQILDAARSGNRIVAVGQRGAVLLSDNGGKEYRQAKSVPVAAALTSVSFPVNAEGWAAGHWGVILHTKDGGETWQTQRIETATDRPLFSIWFENSTHGIAVGLFALALETNDGGATWLPFKLPKLEEHRGDINLFKVFGGPDGSVYIAAEQGVVFKREKGAADWSVTATGNKGSFWSGVALDAQTVLLGGLTGKIYRSGDGGKHWESVQSDTNRSVTNLIRLPNGDVLGTALDGVWLLSKDQGHTFKATVFPDAQALNAAVADQHGTPLVFAQSGVSKKLALP